MIRAAVFSAAFAFGVSLAPSASAQSESVQMIRSLAFSHDGNWLAIASGDNLTNGLLQVVNLSEQEIVYELTDPEVGFVAVDFSQSGLLAVGRFSKTGLLIDVSNKQVVHELQGHDNHVRCVKFTSDGSKLITGSYDRTVKIWEVATGELLQTLEGHPEAIYSLAPALF